MPVRVAPRVPVDNADPPMSATTLFLLHPASALHDTGWGHPEHQGRLRSLASTVGKDMLSLHGRVEQTMHPGTATEDDLLRVHTPAHVERIRSACARAEASGEVVDIGDETRVSSATWEAALGSIGAGITAGRSVLDGTFRNAFVAARPPGHHATPDRAMGFCLFNSIAIVARALQAEGLARRILIVDWDVHHGNGTQDAFWTDPDVFFLSLHQAPFYPGTGAASETGGGAGEGATLNLPLPAGSDGDLYGASLELGLERVAERFTPDVILVSCGFDALAGDPLGGMRLEPEDFHRMTRRLMAFADAHCDGRIVAMLEGGYDPKRTGLATVAVIRALAGVDEENPLRRIEA